MSLFNLNPFVLEIVIFELNIKYVTFKCFYLTFVLAVFDLDLSQSVLNFFQFFLMLSMLGFLSTGFWFMLLILSLQILVFFDEGFLLFIYLGKNHLWEVRLDLLVSSISIHLEKFFASLIQFYLEFLVFLGHIFKFFLKSDELLIEIFKTLLEFLNFVLIGF